MECQLANLPRVIAAVHRHSEELISDGVRSTVGNPRELRRGCAARYVDETILALVEQTQVVTPGGVGHLVVDDRPPRRTNATRKIGRRVRDAPGDEVTAMGEMQHQLPDRVAIGREA